MIYFLTLWKASYVVSHLLHFSWNSFQSPRWTSSFHSSFFEVRLIMNGICKRWAYMTEKESFDFLIDNIPWIFILWCWKSSFYRKSRRSCLYQRPKLSTFIAFTGRICRLVSVIDVVGCLYAVHVGGDYIRALLWKAKSIERFHHVCCHMPLCYYTWKEIGNFHHLNKLIPSATFSNLL